MPFLIVGNSWSPLFYTGLILGSFFYGYIVTQVPAGWLAARFGAKYLFGCGVLLTSVMTMFTPAAAHHSVEMLILVRVVEGLGEVKFDLLSAYLQLETSFVMSSIVLNPPVRHHVRDSTQKI